MSNKSFKNFKRSAGLVAIGLAAVLSFSGPRVVAAETPFTPAITRPRDYQFNQTMSRDVLENYLSRSISVEGVFNGRGNLDDNLRMLKSIGVKYAGRSLCLWGAENNFLANLERAKQQV